MIKAGIIGAAGYTGGEIIRLLLHHPQVEIAYAQSESMAGKKVYDVHRDCFGSTDLEFSREGGDADVTFICRGHGETRKLMEQQKLDERTVIIDLSQDFRHRGSATMGGRNFVYGLPELNRKEIARADSVANPGCFATCIQLALLPLAASKLLNADVHVNATTGSTGAGQTLSETCHFSWRNNNMNAYKILDHQHEKEILESVSALQPFQHTFHFVPQRGPATRGIYAVSYIKSDLSMLQAEELYKDYYSSHPFTHVVPFEVDLKQVVNTNNCFISVSRIKDQLVIISAIDNLLKGASGQAIQNMNILFGLPEKTGLTLKPSAF